MTGGHLDLTEGAVSCDHGGMSSGPAAERPFTDDDARQLAELLARYASQELDQWENWQVQTPYGPVYITMTNALLPDWPVDAFQTIWPLPPRLQLPPPA